MWQGVEHRRVGAPTGARPIRDHVSSGMWNRWIPSVPWRNMCGDTRRDDLASLGDAYGSWSQSQSQSQSQSVAVAVGDWWKYFSSFQCRAGVDIEDAHLCVLGAYRRSRLRSSFAQASQVCD